MSYLGILRIVMEQSTINLLSRYMPILKRYQSQFSSLNTLLGKTTLTGKISSLDIAENLFDYMEKTQEKFENLQEKLINTIMNQSFLNRYEEAQTSMQIANDVLRDYFQKSLEDVSVFVRSRRVFEISSRIVPNEFETATELISCMENFMSSASGYKDILLYSNDGRLIQSLKYNATPKTSCVDVINTDSIESYECFYKRVDFYEQDGSNEFYFVAPIRIAREQSPVVIIVFVLDLEARFKELSEQFPYHFAHSRLVVIDSKNSILLSDSAKSFSVGNTINFIVNKDYSFAEYKSKVYMVASKNIDSKIDFVSNWSVCRIVPLQSVFDIKKEEKDEIESYLLDLETSLLITEELDEVIVDSENINEELGDVVINGEIIASKRHSYALNPILNNIRILSEEMNGLCLELATSIQKSNYETLFNIVRYYSKYSIVSVNELLAESLLSTIWITNAIEFRNSLVEKHETNEIQANTINELESLLARLKDSYSLYHDVLLFDKNGEVIGNSNNDSSHVGEKIALDSLRHYSGSFVVSNFESTSLYGNKNTIIIYCMIQDKQALLGGVAYVFNSELLQDMLCSIFHKESQIFSSKSEVFSVVFDNTKTIIASTNSDFSFETYGLEDIDLKNFKNFRKFIQVGNKHYLICGETSDENEVYTEHTKKKLFSLVFVAVKEDKVDIMEVENRENIVGLVDVQNN